MRAAPEVSIILPTYNRADVIGRAIDSIRAQTFTDWELVVIDDGSTDDTVARLQGLDTRLRIVAQANGGVYVARNTGLREARGRFVTFMDSDDEWLPHYLELTAGFLRSHPDAHWVTTEFLEDVGDGHPRLHDRDDISHVYLRFARSIGSTALELPAGERDDYLRVYRSREPVGAWGQAALARIGRADVQVYSGPTFEHMRWGYMHWLPITLVTRHAIETVGPFTTHTRSAADYRFLSLLARHFTCHMIAVPSAIKYEKAGGNKALAHGHLASGAGAFRFEVNKLSFFDELFWQPRQDDPEIALLRRHYCMNTGHRALSLGHRAEALRYLAAAACWRPVLWRAYLMLALARMLPSDVWSGRIYRALLRVRDIGSRLLGGRLRLGTLLGKLRSRVTR
jgi:glycosyltransferase involved in cell wall biosynthesis